MRGHARDVRAAMSLVALRLRLPLTLARAPLDDVLARAARGGAIALPGTGLPRALALAERLLSRAHVVPDTCLYRALGRWGVLRRAGRDVRFVMGVRADGHALEGHAWIEEAGVPLGEDLDAAYVVTYSHPPKAA